MQEEKYLNIGLSVSVIMRRKIFAFINICS